MKKYFYKLFDLCGLNLLFRHLTRGRIRILTYHGLIKESLPFFNWTSLNVNEFYWQMKYLSENYEVVDLDDIFSSSVEAFGLKTRCTAAITFDDGLRSVAEIAEPILEEFNFTATCFVSPGLSSGSDKIWTDLLYELIFSFPPMALDLAILGKPPLVLDDAIDKRQRAIEILKRYLKSSSNAKRDEYLRSLAEQIPPWLVKKNTGFLLMSKREILNIHHKGRIHVAPHTLTHPILSRLSREEQETEIQGSIFELEAWGIDARKYFAYPNGNTEDYDDISISILKKHGVQYAFTAEDGLYDSRLHDPYAIPRISIGADIRREEFKAMVSGLYYFMIIKYGKIKRGILWLLKMIHLIKNTA